MTANYFYSLLNGLWLTIIMAFCAAVGAIIFGSILAVTRNTPQGELIESLAC